jgi:hypothetical protein
MSSILFERQLRMAKREGRVCSHCGWMISKKNWNKGYRLCAGCWDGLKGVNVAGGYGHYRDEPVDKTGEMI